MAFSLVLIQPIPVFNDFSQYTIVPPKTSQISHTPAHEVGDTKSFWAYDFDTDEFYIADAYLLAIGDYCYIYFEDLVISIIGQQEANDRAALYRDEFDTNIYSRVTDIAGNPNGTLGDVDGDPHIYILIVENRQSYYRQSNEVEGEYSNVCEMVYICYRTDYPVRTISHELVDLG